MKLRLLFVFLLALIINSCATPPSVFVCTRLSQSEGFCVNTITEEEKIVSDTSLLNEKTWLDLVIESVYVPADSWKEIKAYIIKQCKKHNDCGQNIGKWQNKLDKINP